MGSLGGACQRDHFERLMTCQPLTTSDHPSGQLLEGVVDQGVFQPRRDAPQAPRFKIGSFSDVFGDR